jgi:hypothetical protein
MHHEAGKSSMDATYVKKNERGDDLLFINLEDERWNQARMLKRYIETTQREGTPGGARSVRRNRFGQEGGGVKSFFRRMFSSALNRD